MAEFDNKTCTKLEVEENGSKRLLFVKSEWNARCFELAASDGLRAWRFDDSEAFVTSRAEAWDKKPSWVMEKLEFYLKLGQAGVTYRFTKTRDINQRKLSFDIEDKESDLALTANLEMVNASDPESVTCDLLGFLYDSNCRLSESYVKKCDSLTKLLRESVTLVDLNTRLKNAKVEFETDANKKFIAVLNTKKTKARELKKENERLKKEIEKLREDSKSKAGEEDERDDTTSSSSSEDEDDEEKEKESSDHERSTPVERDEAVRERFVSEEIPVMEPGSSSGLNADPDATQPFLDEVEDIDAPIVEPPKEKETPSEMPGLAGDEPYKGIQRKKRRQL